MDFNWVTDRLAIGTTPETLADVTTLQDWGVSHIINCRDDLDDAPLLKGTSITYLWNGTADFSASQLLSPTHKPVEWFQKGIEFALPMFAGPKAKLYVHCIAGANRSATLAWTILRALGLTTAECFAVIDSHRFIDIPGLIECGWWKDGAAACKTLGYVT